MSSTALYPSSQVKLVQSHLDFFKCYKQSCDFGSNPWRVRCMGSHFTLEECRQLLSPQYCIYGTLHYHRCYTRAQDTNGHTSSKLYFSRRVLFGNTPNESFTGIRNFKILLENTKHVSFCFKNHMPQNTHAIQLPQI
jgi:hypothetical protein